eukprot:TRINITY_DN16426_c0_g1_i1.p1 TRINITY_DN16426_c0_g1~~TRINITY_DN16426_c0_g1_i1.p1  ORF type:complete len:243 (-),score=61.42 TRINITY_DN16426_c0_g1_i1:144-872(-)
MAVAVVSGGTRGIGFEVVKKLADGGKFSKIIATGRDVSALAALADKGVVPVVMDLADLTSVEAAVAEVKKHCGGRIDLLLNNAGILIPDSTIDTVDPAALSKTFQVNAMSPLVFTKGLLSEVKASEQKRIVFVTTKVASFSDNGSGKNYTYRSSKAALNMLALNLSIELKGDNVPVGMYHPGLVETEMTACFGVKAGETPKCKSPVEAADDMLRFALNVSMEDSGKVFEMPPGEQEKKLVPW